MYIIDSKLVRICVCTINSKLVRVLDACTRDTKLLRFWCLHNRYEVGYDSGVYMIDTKLVMVCLLNNIYQVGYGLFVKQYIPSWLWFGCLQNRYQVGSTATGRSEGSKSVVTAASCPQSKYFFGELRKVFNEL